jgi:TRAP-type C4-dicarboxylate transport system permease small subunit
MTFLGAIVTLKNNEHLAVNMILKRFPETAKKYLIILGNLIILGVLYFVAIGSWKMTMLNINSTSPATGLPLSVIYISGVVLSISMGIIILLNTYKLITNKVKANDLVPPQQK